MFYRPICFHVITLFGISQLDRYVSRTSAKRRIPGGAVYHLVSSYDKIMLEIIRMLLPYGKQAISRSSCQFELGVQVLIVYGVTPACPSFPSWLSRMDYEGS